MSRYFHTFPKTCKRKPDYSKLFNEEDKAKMQYNKDMKFRHFVSEWQADAPELMEWSLLDFYRAYQNNGVQLAFSF